MYCGPRLEISERIYHKANIYLAPQIKLPDNPKSITDKKNKRVLNVLSHNTHFLRKKIVDDIIIPSIHNYDLTILLRLLDNFEKLFTKEENTSRVASI